MTDSILPQHTEENPGSAFCRQFPRIRRYQFQFTLRDAAQLPAYTGSSWRGLLGHGLRRAVCVMRDTECAHCLLAGGCAHAFIFESLAGGRNAGKGPDHIPPPYILHLGLQDRQSYSKGDSLCLEIRLIGKANDYLPYLIHAFYLAGELGIGRDKARFDVTKVKAATIDSLGWETVYSQGGQVTDLPATTGATIPSPATASRITLTTPLRVKHHGHFLNPNTFDSQHLFNSLARRLAEMNAHYGHAEPSISWRELLAQQKPPQATESRLQWHEWTRYSSRQKSKMQMGGIIGHIDFQPRALQPWMQLLWLWQWLHLGKSSSMGLGAYELNGNLAKTDKTAKKGQTASA
ncbi:MAG: CRISPR system precrRNA processing endoribonuclease RAMP protein Cas6 [gamma proteobacterium symbiont of Bathyaustriella thionipta]|nr:CRISPR system precrRNA processing endoribonuclease RAMP protein Cas6 [gamma proteobacterium symbiont of Bathyaustriella thionipta]